MQAKLAGRRIARINRGRITVPARPEWSLTNQETTDMKFRVYTSDSVYMVPGSARPFYQERFGTMQPEELVELILLASDSELMEPGPARGLLSNPRQDIIYLCGTLKNI